MSFLRASVRCCLSFIPKKIEFDPNNYLDESKLMHPGIGLSLANRRWVTYNHDENARTIREFHDVPTQVLSDAESGRMSKETVEWAAKMLDRPGVVVVSIAKTTGVSIKYYTVGYDNDRSPFVWSN